MDFKRFTDTVYRDGKVDEPMISVRKQGTLTFSMSAMRKFILFDFKFAILFFNKSTKTVGLRLTNDEKEKGLLKLVRKDAGGHTISAQKFLKYIGWDYSKTARYPVNWDEKNELYTFQLK